LLAQKVIPAGNRKKGTLPNASSLIAIAPSLGKEASPPFFNYYFASYALILKVS
jgi:hypothetical protein